MVRDGDRSEWQIWVEAAWSVGDLTLEIGKMKEMRVC